MTVLRASAATDTGYLRVTNQDMALASSDLAAIADGMGGHLGGEVAAQVAVDELLAAFRRDRSTDGLVNAVRAANEAVWQRSRSDRNLRGMGTTLTAAALVHDEPGGQARLALVNVGDSRAYFVDPEQRRLLQLTEDHSVVEEMVRSGELTPDEAAVHPHRHILTRALGIEPAIEPDVWELDLDAGSRLLLCSDGLTNELSEQEIAQVLLDELDTASAADELVRRALRQGGTDNVTVVVLDLVDGEATVNDESVVVVPEPAGARQDQIAPDQAGDFTQAVAVAPSSTPASDPSGARPEPSGAVPGGAAGASALLAAGATGAAGAVGAAGAAGLAGSTTQVTATMPGAPPAVGAPPAPAPHGSSRSVLLVPRTERPRAPKDRIITLRVVLFVLMLAAVFGGTAGVVVWYDKASFFVAFDQGHVAIFQGRPGGMLWFKPSVVERTSLTAADLLPSNIAYLRAGMEEASYEAALNLVHSLARERQAIAPTAQTTTTTATTTTTQPGVVTPTTGAAATATTAPVTTTTTKSGTTTTTRPSPATTTTTRPSPATTTTTKPKKAG